jgi:ketosteroid isomerase-like protein
MAEAGLKLSTDQQIQLVREGFDEFKRGDLKAVGERFTDDAVWHGSGTTMFGGDHRGRQAILQNAMNYGQSYENLSMEVHDVVGNDNHIVALVNSAVTRNGKSFSSHDVYVFHVTDDGKISEAWLVTDTEQLKASLES